MGVLLPSDRGAMPCSRAWGTLELESTHAGGEGRREGREDAAVVEYGEGGDVGEGAMGGRGFNTN
jgi:hypothetical protein